MEQSSDQQDNVAIAERALNGLCFQSELWAFAAHSVIDSWIILDWIERAFDGRAGGYQWKLRPADWLRWVAWILNYGAAQ